MNVFSARNDYERRLVWSKCPWRYFPKSGQTVFTRQYQPWGILPRWPHLFTIDEIHEHPRDKMVRNLNFLFSSIFSST